MQWDNTKENIKYTISDVVECTHWPLIGQAGSIDIEVEYSFIPDEDLISNTLNAIDALDHSVIGSDPEIADHSERFFILEGHDENFLVDALNVFIPELKEVLRKHLVGIDLPETRVTITLNKQKISVLTSFEGESLVMNKSIKG